MGKFNYIELFAGIGGFRQALDGLGGDCVFASEIDKFAKQSYTALYGGNHLHDDITKIEASDIPDHDVIVAGIPCQAFSVAGNRRGFEDTRGTLFFDVARIAKEKQPKIVWIENVKGLVGHDKGKTLDTIVKTLNDIGYTVDFEVLNSKYFGVPQNRERIFIIAMRDDLITPEPWVIEGTTVVPKGKRRIAEYEGVKTFNFDWPEHGEVTTRLRDVLEAQVDEKYYLSEDKTANLVAQLEGIRTEDTPELDMLGHVDIKGNDSIKRVYSTGGVGNALTTMGGGHREPKIAEEVLATLTPDRLEKRQNGPRFKANDEPAHTINTQDRHGVAIGYYPRYRIRKLSPLECWRLQGFTDEAHQTVVDAGLSDSQRYKQAGNAVTVNVITALGEKLLPYLEI